MMKKSIILVLLLTCAAGAVYLHLQHAAAPRSGSAYYADYLPAGTLAAVTLLDLQGIVQAFPESAVGKFVAKPTMRAILTEQGAGEEALQAYDDLYDGAVDLLTNPIIQQLFGDDVTFALLAPDPARLRADPEQEGRNRLIAFGSSAAAASADSLARLTLSDSFSKEMVNDLELTRIRLNDDDFLYGYAKHGVIILAFRPELIAAALQQKAAGGALSASPAFAAAKKFWAESAPARCYGKFYLNPEKLRSLLAVLKKNEAKQAAASLQGVKSLSSVAVVQQGDVQIKTRADYDPAQLHESVRKQYQLVRTQHNLSLHLLTDKTLFYSWFSWLNEELLASIDPGRYQAMDAALQQQLDLSIKEIMAAVGPQAGLTLNEVVSAGLFPLPKLLLFAQIQQPEAARKLVDKVRQKMAKRGLAGQVTESAGHPIYFWSLLPSDAAHPALALTDKMLYLANSEVSLKALLAEEGKELPQTMRELFGPELTARFSAANVLAFVLRPAQLAAAAQKAVSWLAVAFSASSSLSGERLREELFRLMQTLDFAAGSVRAEENHTDFVLVFRRNAV